MLNFAYLQVWQWFFTQLNSRGQPGQVNTTIYKQSSFLRCLLIIYNPLYQGPMALYLIFSPRDSFSLQ